MKPAKIFEYDQYGHPREVHQIKVLESTEDPIGKIVIDTGSEQIEILSFDRDQWGLWMAVNGHTIAQEDGTRSFLDALIKALQDVRGWEGVNQDATEIVVERPEKE